MPLHFADAQTEAGQAAVTHLLAQPRRWSLCPADSRTRRGRSSTPSPPLRLGTWQLPGSSLAAPGLTPPRPQTFPRPSARPQEGLIGQLRSRAHPRANPRQESWLCPPMAAPTLTPVEHGKRLCSHPPHCGLGRRKLPENSVSKGLGPRRASQAAGGDLEPMRPPHSLPSPRGPHPFPARPQSGMAGMESCSDVPWASGPGNWLRAVRPHWFPPAPRLQRALCPAGPGLALMDEGPTRVAAETFPKVVRDDAPRRLP